MAIGDLYNANNVVTGQAAVFVAAQNTALIDLTKWNQTDPFDPTPWYTYVATPGSITSWTFTFARRTQPGGVGLWSVTTSSITLSGLTAASLQGSLAGLANVGAGNVVVTGTTTTGPFYISFDEGLQDGVLTMTPTGGAGSSLAAGWNAVGATEQGWQLGADKSTQTINIEEQSTPVDTTISSQTISLQGSLSEDISKTLTLSLNATGVRTAPTATVPGYSTLSLQDTPIYYAVAMVTQNAEGYGRIVYAPKWTQLGNISAAFRRAAGQRLYGVNFATVCQTNQIQVINFEQAHS